ncbi:MAG: DUF4956 domain-containing protein [Eubacteriales bacterium]|nr:DUF4956 domain-containing protein [Eubacteriales bacterium]
MLGSILLNSEPSPVSAFEFIICAAASLALGVALSLINGYKNKSSKNLSMALCLLPVIVQTVIMLVNGNLGTGVAVMGAFSLVRFRSLPGNSREIVSIFLAMAIGLATGMGYIAVAVLLLVIVGAATVVFAGSAEREAKQGFKNKELKVTIPEDLDYSGIFDDLFDKYTENAELVSVKTVNMGSLYELVYHIVLKDGSLEKSMLDDIRCRNGNLKLVCGLIPEKKDAL